MPRSTPDDTTCSPSNTWNTPAIGMSDAAVLAIAASLIPIAGVFQVFDGLQVVSSGVLRGIGDTRVPMLVGVLGFWLIGFPVSVYLGFRTAAGPEGLWWGFVAGLAAVGVFLLARVRVRLARTVRRVVIDEERTASAIGHGAAAGETI
jgi:MATE family multidrug resistance protein